MPGKSGRAGRLTDHVGATGLRSFGGIAYMLSTAVGMEFACP